MVNVSREQEAAIFAKLAAAYFKNDPHAYTFDGGDDEPSSGKLMAIRWNDFTVLVLQVAEEFPVSLYSTHELGAGELPHHLGNPCTYPLPEGPVFDLEPADILYKAVCADLRAILGFQADGKSTLGDLVEEVRARLQRTPTVDEWNLVNDRCSKLQKALQEVGEALPPAPESPINFVGRIEALVSECHQLKLSEANSRRCVELVKAESKDAVFRLAAIDSTRVGEQPLCPTFSDFDDDAMTLALETQKWGLKGWDAAAALRVENARLKGPRAEDDRFPIHRNARERDRLILNTV